MKENKSLLLHKRNDQGNIENNTTALLVLVLTRVLALLFKIGFMTKAVTKVKGINQFKSSKKMIIKKIQIGVIAYKNGNVKTHNAYNYFHFLLFFYYLVTHQSNTIGTIINYGYR